MSEMQQLTVAQLREFLGQRGLPTSGLKQDLVDRAMAALSKTGTCIAELEEQISDLRARLSLLPGFDTVTGRNPALSSGHFDHWQKQAQARLRQLNILLAQARSDHEERMADTRLAFGRNSAIKSMQAKKANLAQERQRRRAEHQ